MTVKDCRVVHGEYTSRGIVTGDVIVMPAGDFWLRGQLVGKVTVHAGGRAHIIGTLDGDLIDEGGRISVTGTVRGSFRTAS